MIIYWEDIRWEVDDAGTSWATLADEEHNTLTLENRQGKITFHTDGSPRFDASTVLEITALCTILSKEALGQPDEPHNGRIVAETSQPGDADAFVPQQRHALDPDADDTEPESTRLAQADDAERSRRRHPSRSLAALAG
jgi:hypothetical protein